MAEIEFERRGRPLWVVVLIALVLGGGGFYEYTACHHLQADRTLAPTAAPVTAPVKAPVTAPAATPARP